MLVLENPGGEPLDRLIQGPMEITQFLRFAVGLATALSRLHKRGLILKDIKPPNVFVNSATSEVWLMGFGIDADGLSGEDRAEIDFLAAFAGFTTTKFGHENDYGLSLLLRARVDRLRPADTSIEWPSKGGNKY
jgi:serine/threonine protein kinase